MDRIKDRKDKYKKNKREINDKFKEVKDKQEKKLY